MLSSFSVSFLQKFNARAGNASAKQVIKKQRGKCSDCQIFVLRHENFLVVRPCCPESPWEPTDVEKKMLNFKKLLVVSLPFDSKGGN